MKRSAFFRSALALLLCLTMVLSFVPIQAAAEEAKPVAAAYNCLKDGHKYEAVAYEANCKQSAYTCYTCSACGDSYNVYPDEAYSDWQVEKPDVDPSLIQSKTQYRTSQYEMVNSFNTAIDGWELVSSKWTASDSRTVAYVSSWPDGFDRTNSLFKKYDRVGYKVMPYETENRKTEVDSDAIVGYLYYHWCYEGYPYTVDTQSGNYNRFHAYYSTKSPDEADSYDISDNSFRFDDDTTCADSHWYFYVPVYEQKYTDYRKEYTFGTWGNFSDWSDAAVTGNDTMKVGIRTVYRYVKDVKGDHTYTPTVVNATCTAPGRIIYTCTLCGHNYTEPLTQTGHSYLDGKCTACGEAEPNYYLFGYINGANYGCEEDHLNMGQYKFVDGELVVTFKSDSYIGIKTEGNKAWYMTKEYTTEDTATFYNTNTGAGEKMFVPGGVKLTFTLSYAEGDLMTLTMTGGPCSHRYEKTVITAPSCTKAGQAKYVCAKCGDSYTEELAATGHEYRRGTCKGCGLVDATYVTPNYYLVGYINGVDYGSVEDYENRGEFRFENGKLVVNFNQPGYVFVKTEGNTAWYMTMDYCTDTTAVLYDTRDGAMEKMYIPPYMEVTFTLKETANNTLTLSYEAVPCKHIFDDTVSLEPDCENDGIMLRTCRVCTATAEKPIPTPGHVYKAVVTKPSCLTGGYTTYTCTGCDDSYVGDETPAAGHDYNSVVVVEPGCETGGIMTYTCNVCGDSYVGEIGATGHNYTKTVVKPSCEAGGYTTYTCENCSDSYVTDKLPAIGHNHKGVTVVAPSCEADGVMIYTCTNCGDSYKQTMEAMGHNYVSVVTKPTCVNKGYTTHTCTICGYSYTSATVAATGHKFVSGKCSTCGEFNTPAYYLFGYINGANYGCENDSANMGEYRFSNGKLVATFKSDSYIAIKREANATWYMLPQYSEATSATFKNTNTGAGEKLKVPGGVEVTFTLTSNMDGSLNLSYTTAPCEHSYASKVTTAATCIKSGVKTFTCSKCGSSYTEIINPINHGYMGVVTKPTCTTGGYTTFTCILCKDSYVDKIVPATGHNIQSVITLKPTCEAEGVKTYTCTVCNHTYTGKIAATGHSYKDTVTAPDCENAGYTTHTCNVCGDSYKDEEVPALGHDYTSKVITEPTCDTDGEKTYTCDTCGNTYSEVLAATGHSYNSQVTEPTCTKKGYTVHVCSICGFSHTDSEVPALGHSFENEVCTVCGAAEGKFELVTSLGQVTYGGEFVLVAKVGDTYLAMDTTLASGKFVGTAVTVKDNYIVGSKPVWTIEALEGGIALRCEGKYLAYASSTNFKLQDNPYAWTVADGYIINSATETRGIYYQISSGKFGVYANSNATNSGYVSGLQLYRYQAADCEHIFKDGICDLCGAACEHSYTDGYCTACGSKDPSYVETYYLIGYINGADHGCEGDYENMGDYKFVDGKLTVTFAQDSYVFLKTEGNARWFMTESYTEETSATFYNTSTGSKEKMKVPAGEELVFTLTENADGSLTLSYGSAICEHEWTNGVCDLCGTFCEHDFKDKYCTICGSKDPDFVVNYYLIGFINGANYGCEDDYENMGQYKFVDGKLVATFTQDSYVFLKTEGNESWFMTKTYAEETSATFYSTASGANEKMKVPGNVELTFTLTENADGSLALSYVRPACKHNWADGTCTLCGAACEHDYADGFCTVCGGKDPSNVVNYYLIGFINGANYGCEDDHENMGQYKFVDGKLVATFTQDSYVFLKTEGNESWFMTKAYTEETSATFNSTASGANEKMKVPGNVELTFTLAENADGSLTLSYAAATKPVVKPTLALKAPTLEFKDMIKIVVFYTAENLDDVVEMGLVTYNAKPEAANINTADHVIPGAELDTKTGRYFSNSQGIHAKYLGDNVYLSVYAKLSDGSYVYTKVVYYSPITYATNQLKNSTDAKLKQLVAAMLNYGAEAQLYFQHNTNALANASMTAAQKALPESYRADMVSTVPTASAMKQGTFANNKGFSSRNPAISFEGAFCINYFFTPKYAPKDGITLYYWNEAAYKRAGVLTAANATGSMKLEGSGTSQYRGNIEGIAAKALSEAVYVAAVYSDGTTTWTSGVLGYSIGAYCSSQASKGGAVADLAMATAVYGYHAKAYFG